MLYLMGVEWWREGPSPDDTPEEVLGVLPESVGDEFRLDEVGSVTGVNTLSLAPSVDGWEEEDRG